jgi:hypothetical protein
MFARPAQGYLQGELRLSLEKTWVSLPSTKVKRPRPGDPFAWSYTYTGFSLPFARAALEQLGVRPGSTVLDPFAGSGTTLIAAALGGSSALGVDVSPFSALLARVRLATSVDLGRVLFYLNAEPNQHSDGSDLNLLKPRDDAYATAVVSKVCGSLRSKQADAWAEMLADDTGRYDSEVATLLSLALAARDCARVLRGSNPIWYRRIQNTQFNEHADLRAISTTWATAIGRDLENAGRVAREGTCVLNADFASVAFDRPFDFCLTSPPYLNRLDYVIAHLPELYVLQHIAPFDLELLRRIMIGTTKIIMKDDGPVPEEWGPCCRKALESIFNHKSHASRRYYYHTYRQYFARLYACLQRVARLLRRGGRGVIVIQDSYYKDVNVPTPSIGLQMLQSLSCQSHVVRTTPVRMHMGRMSPEQIAYVPQKTLNESLIYFKK